MITDSVLNTGAGDHSEKALQGAAWNFKALRPGWCKCPDPKVEDEVYYRDPVSGSHGWMCVKCQGILQTG